MEDTAVMVVVFVACFTLWLVLSGHFDAVHLALGAVAAGGVAVANRRGEALSGFARVLPGLLLYIPWLLAQIVVSNIQVARLVLHPRLPVDPVVVRYRPGLAGELATTTLANSITLTPGTVTLDVDDGDLVVHALTPQGGASLEDGTMARRVGHVFGERLA